MANKFKIVIQKVYERLRVRIINCLLKYFKYRHFPPIYAKFQGSTHLDTGQTGAPSGKSVIYKIPKSAGTTSRPLSMHANRSEML